MSCLKLFAKFHEGKGFFQWSKPWILHYLKADVEDVQNNSEIKHKLPLTCANQCIFFKSSKSLTVCATRRWNSFSLEHSLESCYRTGSLHRNDWSESQSGVRTRKLLGWVWRSGEAEAARALALLIMQPSWKPAVYVRVWVTFNSRSLSVYLVFMYVCLGVFFSLCGKRTSQSVDSL